MPTTRSRRRRRRFRCVADGRVLEDCDFSVLQAETAEEAIRLLRANRRIGAVVSSDVQMPGSMDGIDLAHWIGRELPRVKVLLTSGKVARSEVGDGHCSPNPTGWVSSKVNCGTSSS